MEAERPPASPESRRILAVGAQAAANPSFRVRVGQLAEALSSLGCLLDQSPLLNEEEERRFRTGGAWAKGRIAMGARGRALREARSSPASVALIQKQADFLPSLTLEKRVADGRRLVYDVDDAIWLDGRGANGHPLAALKRSPAKSRWLASRADAVIAGNPLLAEHLSGYSDRVTVVPSLVDTDSLKPRKHEQADELVLGWVGSPATAAYLEAVRAPIAELARAMPGRRIVLDLIGATLEGVDEAEVRSSPWSLAEERAALGRIDIGLMPMPDTPWTRGKCAYKALLYMAAGVPVVAPGVGITAETIEGAGVIADDDGSWVEGVRALADDAGLRAELGAAGRARVDNDYSIRRWTPEIARILKGEAGYS